MLCIESRMDLAGQLHFDVRWADRMMLMPSRILTDDLIWSNGIATNADASRVHVVDSFGSNLRIFERKQNGRLRLIEAVKLVRCSATWSYLIVNMPRQPMTGDNVSVDPDTGDVYVTGVSSVLAMMEGKRDPQKNKVPFKVKHDRNSTAASLC